MAEPLATVAILTFNGEKYLRAILESVLKQRVGGEIEILVIDSGSSDRTLDIVRAFPAVRLHQIPNSEFGHGRTRNLAARLARGRYIAYLTHDAIPIGELWLHHLLAPMEADPEVVGVMGKQVPRPGCVPMQKYDIRGVFANAGPDGSPSVYRAADLQSPEQYDRAAFYSDVNSAARTSLLRGAIPYRDVKYAEDQFFGRDVLDAGLAKAYAPDAVVEHSNDLTLREYGPRVFDETVGLRRLGLGPGADMTLREAAYRALRSAVGDTRRILHDQELSVQRKLFWWVVNPWFNVAKWHGMRAATRVELDNADEIARRSLEGQRRRKR